MLPTGTKCECCGGPATGSVNGLPFCSSKKCIDHVIALAFKPVRDLLKVVGPTRG